MCHACRQSTDIRTVVSSRSTLHFLLGRRARRLNTGQSMPLTCGTTRLIISQATVHPISGAHDTFRHGLKSAAQAVAAENLSPLQARLEKVGVRGFTLWSAKLTIIQWNSTQLQMQQTMQRNTFGIALPLRQAMEMKIVSEVGAL